MAESIDGVLVVAKEPGPTSHDIVALVRRLTGVKRVGHGGTLDPFAAGVLPVFVGHATRLVEYHLADEKEYRALVCFGARSTTDDLEGELTPVDAPAPTRDEVEGALAAFRGEIEQVPPDYSAVRVAGRKAYELARHGEKPELRPRRVTIARLEITAWDGSDPARPVATVEVAARPGRTSARWRATRGASRCGHTAACRNRSGPPTRRRRAGRSAERPPGRAAECSCHRTRARGYREWPGRRAGRGPRGGATREDAGPPTGLLRIVDSAGRLAAMARLPAGRPNPEGLFPAEDR